MASTCHVTFLANNNLKNHVNYWGLSNSINFDNDIFHIQKKTLIIKLYTRCKIKLTFIQILNYYLYTHCHWTGDNQKAESKGSVCVLLKICVLFFQGSNTVQQWFLNIIWLLFPVNFQCQTVAQRNCETLIHDHHSRRSRGKTGGWTFTLSSPKTNKQTKHKW